MKLKYCLLFLVFAPLVACSPKIDKGDWENEIKPEMLKDLASMKINEVLEEGDDWVRDRLDYYLNSDFNFDYHYSVASDWISSFIYESLPSYKDLANLPEILDNPKTGSAFPYPKTPDESWQVAYIMEFATIIKKIYEDLRLDDLTLDEPEFVKKTKDRKFYSVYCPRYGEYYTLTEDAEKYHWSFD